MALAEVAPPALESSSSPALAEPTVTLLVARRPFTWQGRRFQKGEVLDPQPSGRKREVLGRAGFIVAERNHTVAEVQAIVPEGLVCPACAKVLRTPSGLRTHMGRLHKDG
jgi:hypothetical protein